MLLMTLGGIPPTVTTCCGACGASHTDETGGTPSDDSQTTTENGAGA